jgi:hypothetical protein
MLIRMQLGSSVDENGSTKTPVEPIAGTPRRARPHHRAFYAWLDLNRSRFSHSVGLHKKAGHWAEYSFAGIHPAITGSLTESGLCVSAKYQGECWDVLFDVDAYPKKVPAGYVCRECMPEHKKVFVSREALWADHLFETLLTWVNEKLARAQWLVLQATPPEYSYALLAETKPELAPAKDPEDRSIIIVIPLQRRAAGGEEAAHVGSA